MWGESIVRLAGWLAGWLAAGWLLAGCWLAGYLAGWLAGWLTRGPVVIWAEFHRKTIELPTELKNVLGKLEMGDAEVRYY